MNRKNWFFIGMFLFVVLLFTILYAIGFINYFFEDSEFFIQMKFLDFGSKLLAFFYLIVLSIFFSVVFAILGIINAANGEEKPLPLIGQLSEYLKF